MKEKNYKIIIEIPKGSNVKYEFDEKRKKLVVDRVLYGSNVYPQNYGYFENTLDWDGDPLDGLVISSHSLIPGSEVPIRILGALKMIDNGETDTKLITIIDVDPRFNNINNLNDLSKSLLDEISDFFTNYKKLQKKETIISGFEGEEYAMKELKETKELYKKYNHLSSKEFISKMKIDHPEKYK